MQMDLSRLTVKVFADGADRAGIVALRENPVIKGFTTNPTLMRAAGVADYESFAREILELISDQPISFEVLSDDFADMERQALKIGSWGANVYVKIPVTDTHGESSVKLVKRLAGHGLQLNVTALMTVDQVETMAEALAGAPPAFVSLFAGRIADTGRDPIPIIREALEVLSVYPYLELIWASPREILNIIQADDVGCHVITVTHDLLKKLGGLGRDLEQFSLETVQMFVSDARDAGFTL